MKVLAFRRNICSKQPAKLQRVTHRTGTSEEHMAGEALLRKLEVNVIYCICRWSGLSTDAKQRAMYPAEPHSK